MDECSSLANLTPEQLSYAATTAAVALSKCLSDDEVNVLGSFFVSVGGTLSMIAKQRLLIKNCCDKDSK